jgi:energy-converting hydrogenase A subunit K
MNSEEVIVYLTALVAVGVIAVGLIAAVFHSTMLLPIAAIGIVLAIFIFLARGSFSHKIESIEKLCFIITFLAIICAFILLYKPV